MSALADLSNIKTIIYRIIMCSIVFILCNIVKADQNVLTLQQINASRYLARLPSVVAIWLDTTAVK